MCLNIKFKSLLYVENDEAPEWVNQHLLIKEILIRSPTTGVRCWYLLDSTFLDV